MMNDKVIVIVGYYRLADGFLSFANYFSSTNEVRFFPLLYYENTEKDADIVEDLLLLCDGNIKSIDIDNYNKELNKGKKADIILLWYNTYFAKSADNLEKYYRIKNRLTDNTIIIGYNWDPMPPLIPYSLIKMEFIKNIHYYITCDINELKLLGENNIFNVEHCICGFNPHITFPIYNKKYACDVSIICTNLYDNYEIFPKKYVNINRRVLLDKLYKHRKRIKLHIYGTKNIGDIYPDCYKGYISYENCSKVFTNSKINLCIHAISNNSDNNNIYFSERLPQILGSKGLLYCDADYKTILKKNVNYIKADYKNPIAQIKHILKHYNDYENIINNGYITAIEKLTWDVLYKKICYLYNNKKK